NRRHKDFRVFNQLSCSFPYHTLGALAAFVGQFSNKFLTQGVVVWRKRRIGKLGICTFAFSENSCTRIHDIIVGRIRRHIQSSRRRRRTGCCCRGRSLFRLSFLPLRVLSCSQLRAFSFFLLQPLPFFFFGNAVSFSNTCSLGLQ